MVGAPGIVSVSGSVLYRTGTIEAAVRHGKWHGPFNPGSSGAWHFAGFPQVKQAFALEKPGNRVTSRGDPGTPRG